MNLTSAQKQAYFEARLPGQKLSADGRDSSVRCPFHQDRTASLSVNVDKGVWKCHAGCGQGGLVDFEKRFSGCDDQTAWANIAEVCGLEQPRIFGSKPEAIYSYCDEDGIVLFEKLRYPGKRFSQRAKDAAGKWVYNLAGVRKVLYNLPEVITANHIAICEGEKDADNVNALRLEGYAKNGSTRFIATTNFDGAGKWRPEYSPYFFGKHVVIFPDNDQPGRDHAQQVAASVSSYARDVRIVSLPGLPEKGDVSDYLQTHDAQALLAATQKTPHWKPAEGRLLIPAPDFLSTASTAVDWLVEGVIQRGSNGFICALPKVGKSWVAVDLALSLALGLPWLDFGVSHRTKTAIVTREDNPALTRWRMDRMLRGKNRTYPDLEGFLYVNTRDQSADFRLDKTEILAPMIAALRSIKPEFVILDVFNVMRAADENDNTEMRKVVEQLSVLQREVSCSVAVVHHFNKYTDGSLTQRLRGASAIAGWAEWLIGIESVDSKAKRMSFEIKASADNDPVTYAIKSDEIAQTIRLERVESTPEVPPRRGRRAEEVLQ